MTRNINIFAVEETLGRLCLLPLLQSTYVHCATENEQRCRHDDLRAATFEPITPPTHHYNHRLINDVWYVVLVFHCDGGHTSGDGAVTLVGVKM